MVYIGVSKDKMDSLVAQHIVRRASILAGTLIATSASSIILRNFVESEDIGDLMWYTSLVLLLAAVIPGYRIARALPYVTDYPDEYIGDKKDK